MEKERLRIFIAGSKALSEQRKILRAVLSQLQNMFNVMIEARTYEDFPDSLVDGGRQADYNKYIANEAEIVAFVFDSKVGGITKKEFDVAWPSIAINAISIP